MSSALATALLIATPAAGGEPFDVAAFYVESGPELCAVIADAMNDDNPELLFVCQTEGITKAYFQSDKGRVSFTF